MAVTIQSQRWSLQIHSSVLRTFFSQVNHDPSHKHLGPESERRLLSPSCSTPLHFGTRQNGAWDSTAAEMLHPSGRKMIVWVTNSERHSNYPPTNLITFDKQLTFNVYSHMKVLWLLFLVLLSHEDESKCRGQNGFKKLK